MAIVGIDLGTTNSCVAMIWMGRPEIIPNISGGRTTPSVVGYSESMGILVGNKPKHQRIHLTAPPIEEVKRKMGQDAQITLGAESCSPQQISAYILSKLKQDAEQFLQEPVECSVITIPAYFNEASRRATREAGEMAGLHVAMVLDEPTSAALAYGIGGSKAETILVYDLGGGTLDISVIEIHQNHFEVLAIDGDNWLGGRDFDAILLNYLREEIKAQHKLDIFADKTMLTTIRNAVESAKCDLSQRKDTSIIVEAVTAKIDIKVDIKRELLEELIRSKVESTLVPVARALEKADLEIEEIDQVLLVGGSTRIPMVREAVAKFFEKTPRNDVDPDECIAMGAAIYSSLLDKEVLQNFAGTTTTTLKNKFVVVPRTAHALGIGIDEGGTRFSEILPSGTFYPVSVTRKNYFTGEFDQKGLEIWVYEGENEIAQKNTPLGRILVDLPSGLSAGTSVWITFALNESRILEVTVDLPQYPDAKVKTTINTAAHTEKPEVNQWQRQIETIENLWQHKQFSIAPEKSTEIRWAIESAKRALETNDPETISKKIAVLDHLQLFLKDE